MRGVMHIELENEYGCRTGVTVLVEYEHMNPPEESYASLYRILSFEVHPRTVKSHERLIIEAQAETIFWQRVGLAKT